MSLPLIEMVSFSRKEFNIFIKIEQALPLLTNLSGLYNTVQLNGKQLLLKKVFEGGLIYDGVILRTPQLHSVLIHNCLKMKEKGLLLVEQPRGDLVNYSGCTA